MPNALNNLKISMAAQGLGSIPVRTIIVNYSSDPSANPVASKTTSFVTNSGYWSSAWSSGHPFLMFNQYHTELWHGPQLRARGDLFR